MRSGAGRRRPCMAMFVLIHGAGDDSWFWHRLRPLLETAGHTVVTPDLPCEDDDAGLAAYTDGVVEAIGAAGGGRPLVVVAQSMGGLTAPLVADRVPVDLIVLLTAMIPVVETDARAQGSSGWNMPYPPLLERLMTKTEGRVLRGDMPTNEAAFKRGRVRTGPNDLYVEYDVLA